MATGGEILIVSASESDREGLRGYFEQLGYSCTCLGGLREFRGLVEKKFFPVAILDGDLDVEGAGLDLLRWMRDCSEATACVVLSDRRAFGFAVEAFRLGADDVVLKTPDSLPHLRKVVEVAMERGGAQQRGSALLRDVHRTLAEATRIMLRLARRHYADVSPGSGSGFRPSILLVDHEPSVVQRLMAVAQEKDWACETVPNGGTALDRTSHQKVDVVVCSSSLMDLSGDVVIKSVQARQASTLGLVYAVPGGEHTQGGHIDRYREGRLDETVRPFHNVQQLVDEMTRAVAQVVSSHRDRRVLQAFRSEHETFFRGMADLTRRLERLL